MKVTLSPEAQAILQELLANGEFQSAEEAINQHLLAAVLSSPQEDAQSLCQPSPL